MLTPRFSSFLLAVLGIVLFQGNGPAKDAVESPVAPRKATVPPSVSGFRTPVRFEKNQGQVADSGVRFLARRGRAALFLDDSGSTLSVGDSVVTMRVAGGRAVAPVPSAPLAAKTHYLVGPRENWHTDVPSYERVTYPGVLDGVDLVFHGEEGQIEYDFVVAPGADADRVALDVGGTDSLRVNDDGDLVLVTPHGEMVQARPRVFQGARTIPARYRLAGANRVAFNVGDYDHAQPLVIDPTVVFATYLGSTGTDTALSLATDSSGNMYVAGSAERSTTIGGVTSSTRLGPALTASTSSDMYVAKLSPTGALTYLTYVGGNGFEEANGVAVTSTGRPVIAGYTTSSDIPTAGGPAQAAKGAGQDIYVAELAADGASLLYASYIDFTCTGTGCTTHNDVALAVALNGDDVYLAGTTSAQSPAVLTAAHDGAFVYEFSLTSPATPKYVNILGGGAQASASSIAVTGAGSVYIAGQANVGSMTNSTALVMVGGADLTPGSGANGNAFFAKLGGAGISYGTYLRGSGSNSNDHAYSVVVDSAGIATVAGQTSSADFRTTPNAYQSTYGGGLSDAFVARIDPSALGTASLVFSTYLGGGGDEGAHAVTRDASGDAIVTGYTTSSDFPLPAAQAPAGGQDAFVTVLGADGKTLLGSALVGGGSAEGGHGVGVVGSDVVLCGFTNSSDFPTKTPAQATAGGGFDAFVARVNIAPAGITINASATTTPPKGKLTFTASGGTGALTFDLAASPSGGTITADGAYTAGGTGSVTDTVRVKDTNGGTKSIDITVGPGIKISPESGNYKDGETAQLTATGGAGAPYTWSLSGGGKSISSTGLLTSDGKNVQVQAVDSLGNYGYAEFNRAGGLLLTPTLANVAPLERVTLTVSGGTAPYTWTALDASVADGALETTTGASVVYKASAKGNGNDTIQVSDAKGATATTNIFVGPPLHIDPATADVGPGGSITMKLTGGKSPYVVSFKTNASGGNIDSATFVYKAGDRVGQDIVTATDALGATFDATFNVTPNGGAVGTSTAPVPPPPSDNACGCRTVPVRGVPKSAIAMAIAATFLVVRRRRR